MCRSGFVLVRHKRPRKSKRSMNWPPHRARWCTRGRRCRARLPTGRWMLAAIPASLVARRNLVAALLCGGGIQERRCNQRTPRSCGRGDGSPLFRGGNRVREKLRCRLLISRPYHRGDGSWKGRKISQKIWRRDITVFFGIGCAARRNRERFLSTPANHRQKT